MKEKPIDTYPHEAIAVHDEDASKVNLSCSFDFLGIKVSGNIDHFFETLLASKYFSLDSLSEEPEIKMRGSLVSSIFRVVNFCGVPCGMNVQVECNRITNIKFVTSQRSRKVVKAFNKALTGYYGKPDTVDDEDIEDAYGRYAWYSEKATVVSRNLKQGAEGWTIYFSR